MTGPTITITHPKKLCEEDFSDLRGTALYEKMFRNRSVLTISDGSGEARHAAYQQINFWLSENCKSFYRVDAGASCVYIEDDADAMNFKMMFSDFDIEIPPSMRPPPPPKTIPSSQVNLIHKYLQSTIIDLDDDGEDDFIYY